MIAGDCSVHVFILVIAEDVCAGVRKMGGYHPHTRAARCDVVYSRMCAGVRGMGGYHPLTHGAARCDAVECAHVRVCLQEFFAVKLGQVGINRTCNAMNHTSIAADRAWIP